MSDNIIRRDVIEIALENNEALTALRQMQEDMNRVRQSFDRVGNSDGLENATRQSNKLKDVLDKIAKTSFSAVGKGLKMVGSAAAGAAKLSAKAIGVAAGGISALVAGGVNAYANYEQLVGGVDTLFKDSSKRVQAYANDAYKTAGLSANDYMETVTSFSASLLQGLNGDTKKAADIANQAIVDMSDNANKMGTDMASIQNAYQGFAKQNYTMLDNLKLGYGGTQTEMQRLIKDAAKMDKSVKANSMSYDNIIKAIHAVQVNLDITGTTAKEANTTIQGSLASMKSAWGNLLTSLVVGGDSFDQCVNNLVESIVGVKDESGKAVGGVLNNIMPAIEKAMSGVGTLIEQIAPIAEEHLPKLINKLLPPLIKMAVSVVKGLIKALPDIIQVIIKELPHIARELWQGFMDAFGNNPIIQKIVDKLTVFFSWIKEKFEQFKTFLGWIKNNSNLVKNIAKGIALSIIGVVAAIKGLKIINKVSSFFSAFGGGMNSAVNGSEEVAESSGIFSSIANMKVKTVLKGMANIAIIIGGFTLIAAAIMALAPYMAKLTDVKSLVKVVATISVLGVIGTGLAYFAGIVGKIPITTVLKGLANMAIMLAGMTAVAAAVMFVAPYIAPLTDNGSLIKVIATIGILGTVGAVLSVFAGIVGAIPISVVLLGLANITLVLGAFTLLVLAFGKLSEVKGFNEFISKGGDTLAKLFGQLGKIIGAFTGGVIESISASLPMVADNIASFMKKLAPAFSAFKGIDMSGVGTFFSSIGSFMLKMAGNDLASIFTGGTNLPQLGTDLTAFMTNASQFFVKVATIPPLGFENAGKLFQSLADIGNVPKTGGLAQWFSGETNFGILATGLASLSNDNVISFYTKVANIPESGFTNAEKLFKSLSSIDEVPKKGGLKQWFSGESDLSGLANKLPPFGEAVAKFYNSISGISDTNKISSLFRALGSIGESVGKSGGAVGWVSEKIGGSEKTGLQVLGESLKTFGTNTATFFKQVNDLNLTKLNGLWDSLKKPKEITDNLSNIVGSEINSIVKMVSKLPEQMGMAIKSGGTSLKLAMSQIWKDAVSAAGKQVNKLIGGANFVLGEFGSNKRVKTWKYAGGTNGHKGGNALVNDGRGAELIRMPNGQTFIPNGRNVFIPNAPKGMQVLSAENTAGLMGRNKPTYKYKDGNIDVYSFLDNEKGLVSALKDKYVSYKGLLGFKYNITKSLIDMVGKEMIQWAKKLFGEFGAIGLANYNASAGVEQWRSTVIQALKMEGLYNEANVRRTLYQMQTESGGNPKAINLWDSNAKRGIPSKGLMQVIDPTFKTYARKGYDKNIYDPLSNILASIRYSIDRYGSLERAYRGVGYANGGIANRPSIFGEAGAEMAIPLSQSKRNNALSLWNKTGDILGVERGKVENNTYSPVFNLTINGSSMNERELEAKTKAWIKESMQEFYESMSRRKPRLTSI